MLLSPLVVCFKSRLNILHSASCVSGLRCTCNWSRGAVWAQERERERRRPVGRRAKSDERRATGDGPRAATRTQKVAKGALRSDFSSCLLIQFANSLGARHTLQSNPFLSSARNRAAQIASCATGSGRPAWPADLLLLLLICASLLEQAAQLRVQLDLHRPFALPA